MRSLINFLKRNPEVSFFISAFILWTVLMCNENSKEGGDFSWHDIKVEANGMIFDLFVFGVLVSIYNGFRADKDKIERLKEEIDDYRGWDEKEAMYRIIGIIKRLNKLGVSKIDLRKCFLHNADLIEANLQKADLSEAKLQGANFQRANLNEVEMSETILDGANLQQVDFYKANLKAAQLQGANLRLATLNEADLWGADLTSAKLQMANCQGTSFRSAKLWNTILQGANLEKSDLTLADLREADFQGANLQGANLNGANLQGTNLQGANLQGVILQSMDYLREGGNAPYPYHPNVRATTIGLEWLDKLDEWGVIGSKEIRKKYQIDDRGRLQLK
jgi:uncharacterized protein YjbI with pentapeptide repeats